MAQFGQNLFKPFIFCIRFVRFDEPARLIPQHQHQRLPYRRNPIHPSRETIPRIMVHKKSFAYFRFADATQAVDQNHPFRGV